MNRPNSHPRPLGSFTNIPLEVLQSILLEVKYVQDTISFTNTCKTFRKVLGKENKLPWYTIGSSRNASVTNVRYRTFDAKYNYHADIKKMCGLGPRRVKKYCQFCFLGGTNHLEIAGYRVCLECARKYSLPASDFRLIPGLNIDGLRPYNWSKQQIADILSLPIEDPSGFPAIYVLQPIVERKLAVLYPDKNISQILARTQIQRQRYDAECSAYFAYYTEHDCERITTEALWRMRPILQLYVDLKTEDSGQTVEGMIEGMWGKVCRLAKEKYAAFGYNIKQGGYPITSPTQEKVVQFGKEIAMELTFHNRRL